MTKRVWCIPITLVEYGREAIIEAKTRAEAIEKLRLYDWRELTDPQAFTVTKVGRCRVVDENTIADSRKGSPSHD